MDQTITSAYSRIQVTTPRQPLAMVSGIIPSMGFLSMPTDVLPITPLPISRLDSRAPHVSFRLLLRSAVVPLATYAYRRLTRGCWRLVSIAAAIRLTDHLRFHGNHLLDGSFVVLWRRLAQQIVCGSVVTTCSTDHSTDHSGE